MSKIFVNSFDDLHTKMKSNEKYMACINKEGEHVYSTEFYAHDVGFKNNRVIEGKTFYDWPVPACEMADIFIQQIYERIEKMVNKVYFFSSRFLHNEHRSFIYNMIPILNYDNIPFGILVIPREIYNDSNIIQAVNDLSDVANAFSFNKQFLVKSTYPGLSKRESECLFWLLRGKTASKIAVRLNISIRTVETHLENIKNKFSCNTRSEIFDTAVDIGLLNVLPVL